MITLIPPDICSNLTVSELKPKLDDKKEKLQFVFAKAKGKKFVITIADGAEIKSCYGPKRKDSTLGQVLREAKESGGWVELKKWVRKQ